MEVHGGGMMGEMHKRLVGKRELLGDLKLMEEIIGQEAQQAENNAIASGLAPPFKQEVLTSQPLEENHVSN